MRARSVVSGPLSPSVSCEGASRHASCERRAGHGDSCSLGSPGADSSSSPSAAAPGRDPLPMPSPGPPRTPMEDPRTRAFGARKHKMEAQPEGVPLPKKRLTEDAAAAMEDPPWALGLEGRAAADPGVNNGANAAIPTSAGALSPPRPAPEMPPWEEMEEAPGESPAHQQEEEEEEEEAARRRLREIEERIIDEEEEEEEEEGEAGEEGRGRSEEADAGLAGRSGSRSGLPTLVLSDTLKTGLRRDFEGGLTKKIIESMSRPSMELVLWKPLPGFLTERAKMAPLKAFGINAERGPQKPEPLGAPHFGSQQAPARGPTHPPPPLLYGNASPAEGPSAEEEMEL